MSFPRYPSYKDSGVEWLGNVPEHWEVKLVKNLASIVNGYPFDSALFDAAEGSPLVRIRDLNKSEAETFYKGEFVETAAITSDDVLIGMDGDFNVGRWRGQGRALLNQRMCCVRGKSNVLTRLLEYSLPLRLKAINDVTYATTVKHLASSQVEKSFVAIPPDTIEQTQIAAFLDRETAKIDELVTEQRRLMELLKEKRQAVISHAVTQGLNPHAPMKPSGIEWLGDVPEHWEVVSLKRFCDVRDGTHDTPQFIDTSDVSFPFVTSKDLVNGQVCLDETKHVSAMDYHEISRRSGVARDDVLMPMIGSIGGAVLVETDVHFAIKNIALFKASTNYNSRWLQLMLDSDLSVLQFELNRSGGVQGFVALGTLRNLSFPFPSLDEQDKIVSFLGAESTKFDTLTTEAQRAIDLLQERRTALISAAVTGQIDVRPLLPARKVGAGETVTQEASKLVNLPHENHTRPTR